MKKKLVVLFILLVLVGGFSPLALASVSDVPYTCTGFGGTANGGVIIGGGNWDFKSVVCRLEGILSALIPLLIGLGMVYFIWGVITYVIASDEEGKKDGRNRMIYGIIGFTVIIFLWGLVAILANTLGLNNATQVTFPTFNSQ